MQSFLLEGFFCFHPSTKMVLDPADQYLIFDFHKHPAHYRILLIPQQIHDIISTIAMEFFIPGVEIFV